MFVGVDSNQLWFCIVCVDVGMFRSVSLMLVSSLPLNFPTLSVQVCNLICLLSLDVVGSFVSCTVMMYGCVVFANCLSS